MENFVIGNRKDFLETSTPLVRIDQALNMQMRRRTHNVIRAVLRFVSYIVMDLIVGGFIGAKLGFGAVTGFNIGSLLIATGGAVLLLAIYRP